MRIHFHTNLDMAQRYLSYDMGETWDHVPAVGTYVEIPLPIEPKGATFELQVIQVRYNVKGEATVELHIPAYTNQSVLEWEQWMKRRLRQF